MKVTLIILLFLIVYLLYMRPTVYNKYMTILLIAACLFLLYKCITCYIEWKEYEKLIKLNEKK